MKNDSDTLFVTDDTSSRVHRSIQVTTWVGAAVNLFLSITKIVAGYLGNSQAVVADGVHSLSDLVTDAAILIGSQFWSKPADEKHPHGHRRIETLVTIGVSLALLVVGAGIGWDAIEGLRRWDATIVPPPPGWLAIGAACASIVLKEVLYRWTAAVGREIKSPALIANAWHHRSDVFSSIPVVIAVLATRLQPGWSILDKIGALVVTVFIFQAALRILTPALRELADTAAPLEIREKILAIASQPEGVLCVHKIRTRQLGSGYEVDLHLLVDGAMTVQAGHDICELARQRLLMNGPDIVDVVIHLEPYPCGSYLDCPQRPEASP